MPWPQFDADHVLVTSKQMAIIEQEIFKSGLPVAALMEKVGIAMSTWFLDKDELLKNGVLFLIGPGHNGGDGLVVARELHNAGIKVKIWCPFKIKKDLTANHFSHVKWIGIEEINDVPDVNENILWVDAIFGLGQSRDLPNNIEFLFKKRQEIKPGQLISLDIPSGICSDSGDLINKECAVATFTLTPGLLKRGLVQDSSKPYIGKIVRIDLGISDCHLKYLNEKLPLKLSSKDISSFPWPELSPNSMKYQRGRVLVIAGSKAYRGASLLALQGSLASGVGCIQSFLPSDVAKQIWQVAPEVILKGVLEEKPLSKFLQESDLEKLDVVLIGPGLGITDLSWIEESNDLQRFKGLLVVDADGLNQLSMSTKGMEWLLKREGFTWITPHKAEFQRLFPQLKEFDPIEAAIRASELSGAAVLLKGANSVASAPDGRTWQLVETSQFAARTGWGDVLAGFTAGLGAIGLAQKSQFEHNLLPAAALLHAEAARKCSKASNASTLSSCLAELTRLLQERSCNLTH